MAKTDFKTIEDYINSLTDENKAGVRAICNAIMRAVPEIEGIISYQIPAFRHCGWIFYVSAHKDHYSLSCLPPIRSFEAFEAELAYYAKTRSALKLPKKEPLPVDLIEKMAACHAKYNVQKANSHRNPVVLHHILSDTESCLAHSGAVAGRFFRLRCVPSDDDLMIAAQVFCDLPTDTASVDYR